ncbi:3-oxoacyl-[acyl-carrier-protein] reductase [Wandonia haliotis]|uniref:3-oxoacyl-[acyl-carrier-protein] reductase n=1 Tax=Wandonia haliotis TaxID=574963 RepID=A0ABN1MSX1_9FLAO
MEKDKKVVVLTGASGGVGAALSVFLAEKGYRLALHYNEHAIESVPEGEDVHYFQADLRDSEQISAMMDAVLAVYGRIDILINNAGISRNGMSWKLDEEDWSESILINLTAPFLLSQKAIPVMRSNGWGRIINVSSVVGQTGFIGTSAYAASKSGLFGLTKTMAKELAAFGITVNSLALGYMDTGMITGVSEELQEEIKKQIPLKRLGTTDVITTAVEFLLSDGADYYTGQTLNLNGGLH